MVGTKSAEEDSRGRGLGNISRKRKGTVWIAEHHEQGLQEI